MYIIYNGALGEGPESEHVLGPSKARAVAGAEVSLSRLSCPKTKSGTSRCLSGITGIVLLPEKSSVSSTECGVSVRLVLSS